MVVRVVILRIVTVKAASLALSNLSVKQKLVMILSIALWLVEENKPVSVIVQECSMKLLKNVLVTMGVPMVAHVPITSVQLWTSLQTHPFLFWTQVPTEQPGSLLLLLI